MLFTCHIQYIYNIFRLVKLVKLVLTVCRCLQLDSSLAIMVNKCKLQLFCWINTLGITSEKVSENSWLCRLWLSHFWWRPLFFVKLGCLQIFCLLTHLIRISLWRNRAQILLEYIIFSHTLLELYFYTLVISYLLSTNIHVTIFSNIFSRMSFNCIFFSFLGRIFE